MAISGKSISSYAPINGLSMYYEIHGAGAPLVLIHGGGSTIDTTFGRVIPLLAQNFEVIAVEMQAHGRTADIDRPLTFQQDADDIAALLSYLKIERANVFGFSNGACTTLHLSIRHSDRLNKIIVASTFYNHSGIPPRLWDALNDPSFDNVPQEFIDAFLKVNPDKDALMTMFQKDIARMQSFPDITDEQMHSIKTPSLILIGNHDIVSPEHAVKMHHLIRHSELIILPGGHGDYMGALATPQDPLFIKSTTHFIDLFLNS